MFAFFSDASFLLIIHVKDPQSITELRERDCATWNKCIRSASYSSSSKEKKAFIRSRQTSPSLFRSKQFSPPRTSHPRILHPGLSSWGPQRTPLPSTAFLGMPQSVKLVASPGFSAKISKQKCPSFRHRSHLSPFSISLSLNALKSYPNNTLDVITALILAPHEEPLSLDHDPLVAYVKSIEINLSGLYKLHKEFQLLFGASSALLIQALALASKAATWSRGNVCRAAIAEAADTTSPFSTDASILLCRSCMSSTQIAVLILASPKFWQRWRQAATARDAGPEVAAAKQTSRLRQCNFGKGPSTLEPLGLIPGA